MSVLIQQSAIRLKCQRCSHGWYYKGKNRYVATCPHCRTYVTIKKSKILLIGKDAKPQQSEESIRVRNLAGVHNYG